jgi:hypothetical protein
MKNEHLCKPSADAKNPRVVLQAAISIRKPGDKASPLIPVIEQNSPSYRGPVRDRYKDWIYPMFIGFALDQTYLNCGLAHPRVKRCLCIVTYTG